MTPYRIGLAPKLALCLLLSTLLLAAAFGWSNLRFQRRTAESLVLSSADRAADLIERSARFSMMRNDRVALYHLIQDIGAEPGIRRVRIFNEQGFIRYSTDHAEVNTAVNKQAEACFACHAAEQPLTRLARPDHARTFVSNGERLLGVIKPIENRAECYNAACHAHPKERRILGVIDAHLSLAAVDRQLAEHQRYLLAGNAGAVLLFCCTGALFLWIFVHRPVRRLTEATVTVAGGDLTHRIPIASRDELGVLAESFNHMMDDLESAHTELTGWNKTLERRVDAKSRELQRAHDSLVASENLASIGKLAATVAHEVNNPLFGMLTYARLVMKVLHKSDLQPSVKADLDGHLRVIERESKRCGEILKHLLEFARHGGSAAIPPRIAPTDLNLVLRRALKLVHHQLELQHIALDTRFADPLPHAACDSAQIEQATLALLINAVEAMPLGGVLTVISEDDPDHACCRARIRDTGCGISAENLSHIFEPFFTTKEFRHSTGLGLPIAKGIIERHGGQLTVTSEPERGTEFLFTLPVVFDAVELPVARPAAPTTQPAPSGSG
jgi:two-component system NtrC family sensor kinase